MFRLHSAARRHGRMAHAEPTFKTCRKEASEAAGGHRCGTQRIVKWVGEGDRNESFQISQYDSNGGEDPWNYDEGSSLWAYAGGGNDFIYGKDQNDYLYGQGGRDLIGGYYGYDMIFGDFTKDDSAAGSGLGGDGDFIVAGGGRDHCFGSVGDDFILGGKMEDFIDGGTDNDILWGGVDADRIYGQSGNDVLLGHGPETDGSPEQNPLLFIPDYYKLVVTYVFDYDPYKAKTETRRWDVSFAGSDETNDPHSSDTLDGGAGDDTLDGGGGRTPWSAATAGDTFTVDNAGDRVDEFSNGGFDTIRTSVSLPRRLRGSRGAERRRRCIRARHHRTGSASATASSASMPAGTSCPVSRERIASSGSRATIRSRAATTTMS